jgi:steroid 5-alpha reductase family enzyme
VDSLTLIHKPTDAMIWPVYLEALSVILAVAVVAWVASIAKRDVSFVDSLWSLFFLIAAGVFLPSEGPLSVRAILVFWLVAVWALRLSVYITARNWGKPEDYRYQQIRRNNSPGFAWKSLYIVFGLQALLAWIVAQSLLPALQSPAQLTWLDGVAASLWCVGFVFEAGGDYQLSAFRRDPGNRGKVLDSSLWRLTRHPNYFGDFCIWWAFYLFSVSAGSWWTVASPLLMSVLLLKVSGVAMLEKTISDRRPGYAEYARRTNAFFPWPKRSRTAR